MKSIVAIGGAVIKTAKKELISAIKANKIEMLIHNGGSIFHDFQQATDPNLESHSYPLDDLLKDYSCNKEASKLVWKWISGGLSPANSVTNLCKYMGIDVLLFTGLACDFWHMFAYPDDWGTLGRNAYYDYIRLVSRFRKPFHYICMGSAVIHPEVFTKALAQAKATDFTADVVDFKDMYRPRTRVAKFGTYYHMTHKEFLTQWLRQ